MGGKLRPSGTRGLALIILAAALTLGGCGGSGGGGPDDGEPTSPAGIRLPPAWTPTAVISPIIEFSGSSWQPCPDAPLSQLRIGDIATQTAGTRYPGRLRDKPDWDEGSVVGLVEPAERVEVLEGPVCQAQLVWWRVRILGQDVAGWTVEGNAYGSWLIPAQ